MKRDVFLVSGGILGLGLLSWTFWGNPESSAVPRVHTVQILHDDPDLRLVSERSPYMRTER